MMVQVLEADERSVRLSSLQTGRRERPPQTPERDSLLALMVESALFDASSLQDLQSTFTPLLKPLWKSPPPRVELSWTPAPSSVIHEHRRRRLTRAGLRSKTIRHDSKLLPAPQLMS